MAIGNKVGNNTSDKSKGDTQNKKAVRNKSTKDLETSLEDFDNEEYSVKNRGDNGNSERKRPKTADVGTQCAKQENGMRFLVYNASNQPFTRAVIDNKKCYKICFSFSVFALTL